MLWIGVVVVVPGKFQRLATLRFRPSFSAGIFLEHIGYRRPFPGFEAKYNPFYNSVNVHWGRKYAVLS